MNEPHIFSKYGGTRFLLALGSCLINTLLLMHGDISEKTYEFLIMGTVGAFITGNTVQNAASFMARGKSDVN